MGMCLYTARLTSLHTALGLSDEYTQIAIYVTEIIT